MFVTQQHWSTEGTYLPLKKKKIAANSVIALNVTNSKQEGRKRSRNSVEKCLTKLGISEITLLLMHFV